MKKRPFPFILFLFIFFVFLQKNAFAQSMADELSNFGSSDQPIEIESDSLEVFDDQQMVVFKGNVFVKQGDATMRTALLKVFYSKDQAVDQQKSAQLQGGRQLQRLEASGKVAITSNDQTATSERAFVNMDTQMITMEKNVVLTQGGNIVRGDQLVINMETKQSRMEALPGTKGKRVQGLFIPGSANQKN